MNGLNLVLNGTDGDRHTKLPDSLESRKCLGSTANSMSKCEQTIVTSSEHCEALSFCVQAERHRHLLSLLSHVCPSTLLTLLQGAQTL